MLHFIPCSWREAANRSLASLRALRIATACETKAVIHRFGGDENEAHSPHRSAWCSFPDERTAEAFAGTLRIRRA